MAQPSAPESRLRTVVVTALRCLGLWATAGLGACVTHTYQPMSGLHRPVVIDTGAPNFVGTTLRINCVPKDLLKNMQDATSLCDKLTTLFENQGAVVTTALGVQSDELVAVDGQAAVPIPDLTLELHARQVHAAGNPLSWAAMLASFTLVPAFTEFTFEQGVVVRDGSGFLLATDELRGKVTHYYGFGAWASNKLLDLTAREKENRVIGAAPELDLSNDLYRQLSQTVFNASLQAEVLKRSGPRTTQEDPPAPAEPSTLPGLGPTLGAP